MQQVEVPDKDSAVAWLRPRLPHLRTLHVRYAPSGCGSDACSVSEGPLSLLLTSFPPPAAPLLEALVLFTEWDKVGFQDTQDVNNHLLCSHKGFSIRGGTLLTVLHIMLTWCQACVHRMLLWRKACGHG